MTENVCAMLTAPGRAAVAVIGVNGKNATEIVDSLFRSATNRRLAKPTSQTIFYGQWIPTGEDIVVKRPEKNDCDKPRRCFELEIHCHGGYSAPKSIVQALIENGCRHLSPEEASLQLHSDPRVAEIASKVSQAPTERTARLLLQQLQLAKAHLKSGQAFTDADLETRSRWAEWGKHLVQPWSVVFCGQPNVGKSSLMNAIVGFNRVIVHETAGTTRDVVAHLTAIEGWPVELKDTAGIRESTDIVEQQGVGFAQAEIRNADLLVIVNDARDVEQQLAFQREQGRSPIVVANKSDLLEPEGSATLFDADSGVILTSTKTGRGIGELVATIASRLVPELPPSDRLIL